MAEQDFNVALRRNWFGGGKTISVSLLLAAPNGKSFPFADFLSVFLAKLSDHQGLSDAFQISANTVSSIRNLRGHQSATKKSGEQLLALHGKVLAIPTLPSSKQNYDPAQEEPFHFLLNTKFHSFIGSKIIVHSVEPQIIGKLLCSVPRLSARQVAKLVPVELTKAELGFEFYQSRFFGSALGLSPTIVTRCYLDITPQKIIFFYQHDAATKNFLKSLEAELSLNALDATLRQLKLLPHLMRQIIERC